MDQLYALPLRIREEEAGFRIIDAHDLSVTFVWADQTPLRASILKHPDRERGRLIAQRIARALTDAAS